MMCASCLRLVQDGWTYCPYCGAQERAKSPAHEPEGDEHSEAGCDRCERFRDESGHYPYCPVGEGMQQGRCSCNERPSPPPPVDEALELKRLITGYVNAYDAGLSRHENVGLELMRKVAREHEGPTATKCARHSDTCEHKTVVEGRCGDCGTPYFGKRGE